MKKLLLIVILTFSFSTAAKPPDNSKSKFYDFGEQIIDGEIRKPTALYMDARKRARFDRLLSLKRSFLRDLFNTARNKIFK